MDDKSKLVEVDSAVDLEYNSHCGTPTDLPPYGGSITNSHLHLSLQNQHEPKGLKPCPRDTEYLSNSLRNVTLGRPAGSQDNRNSVDNQSLPAAHLNNDSVTLCLKLPNGDRLQTNLPLTSKLSDVVTYAENSSGVDLKECEIFTNEIPRRVFEDHSMTLLNAGITVRTVLHFSSL